jgi:NAD(P)-dependent dehydrogenase (short-subunit alcohol dehydrogenase family)
MTTALVTGTSSGIGFATAVSLARAGHFVFAAMRNPDGGGALRELIEAENLPVSIVTLDVDDDGSVADAIEGVLKEKGHIDVLVNNAGIGGGGAVEEVPIADFRQIMETNFFGALRCIQAVLPHMRQRRQGCIVNITSIAGRIANAPQAPYAASKWALEALGECLAQEVKPFNIRVALVEPGIIATPIFGNGKPAREGSPYPHSRRMGALFQESLKNPVPPEVVAEKILEIVEQGSWQLRYPVGADALSLLEKRAATSDEEWIDRGALSDEEWVAMIKRERGLDIKL